MRAVEGTESRIAADMYPSAAEAQHLDSCFARLMELTQLERQRSVPRRAQICITRCSSERFGGMRIWRCAARVCQEAQ